MAFSPYSPALLNPRRPQAPDEPAGIFGGPRGSRYKYTTAKKAEVRHLVETTLMTYAEIARRTGIPGRTVCHWANTRKWMRPLPLVPHRPRGPRRSHVPATVSEVRHLVETTLMTYAQIAQRTGVLRATIWKWSKTRKWMRPSFAPRWTHTVPAWRAGRARKRRMLALRLIALAERTVRTIEAASAVDVFRLREARSVLAMARRVTQTPRQRLLAAVRPVPQAKPRAPGNPVARKAPRAPLAAPAMDRMIESPRQDGAPRPPHPGALRRETVAIARPK